MKTETQIAQVNIEELDLELPLDVSLSYPNCQEHKASCERFLEFLEEWNECGGIKDCFPCGSCLTKISEMILDLKQTIKLYSENGI